MQFNGTFLFGFTALGLFSNQEVWKRPLEFQGQTNSDKGIRGKPEFKVCADHVGEEVPRPCAKAKAKLAVHVAFTGGVHQVAQHQRRIGVHVGHESVEVIASPCGDEEHGTPQGNPIARIEGG